MKHLRWAALGAALALVALAAGACGGDDSSASTPTKAAASSPAAAPSPTPTPPPWQGKKITFAVVPASDQQKLLDDNKALKNYLEKALPGLTVDLFTGPSYAVVVEAAKSEKVDFVIWGPFSYIEAKDTGAKIESALATVADASSKPGYYSLIMARADSGITKLDDIKGREDSLTIAYADLGSTSGFLAPNKMLKDAGINISILDKHQLIAGGHDKDILAVFQGTTKLGGTPSGEVEIVDLELFGQGFTLLLDDFHQAVV